MIRLYHIRLDDLARETQFALSGPPNTARPEIAASEFAGQKYDFVAEASMLGDIPNGLQSVYRWTQNGVATDSWSRHPPVGLRPVGVTEFIQGGRRYGRRSTMIGDIMEVLDDAGAVTARFVVDWIGFAPMPIASNDRVAAA